MSKLISLLIVFFISINADETCILNFNQKVCSNFQIMPSVIVKTALSKKELKSKIKKPLKQIAFLEKSNLFLIETTDSLVYAKTLLKKEFIIYAQPNILQEKENLKRKVEDVKHVYNLEKIWKKSKGQGIKVAIIDDGFNLKYRIKRK